MGRPRPCPRPGGTTLKALLVGLCAFMLVTQVIAATSERRVGGDATARRSVPSRSRRSSSRSSTRPVSIAAPSASSRTIALLLSSTEHGRSARTALGARSGGSPAVTTEDRVTAAVLIARREARRLAKAPPKVAICAVFGALLPSRRSASPGASPGSRPRPRTASTCGLFQMGSSERRLFGHGATAHEQALAAHRYFVVSGRDWSPWSCSWARRPSRHEVFVANCGDRADRGFFSAGLLVGVRRSVGTAEARPPRPLDEASAYARCHGDRDDNVRHREAPAAPGRATRPCSRAGRAIRRDFEERLDTREPESAL